MTEYALKDVLSAFLFLVELVRKKKHLYVRNKLE